MLRDVTSIKKLKDALKGESVFIAGNGPSIRAHDLPKLKRKHVIGMNASPILEKEFGFMSEYYVVSDLRFLNHPEKRKYATDYLDEKTIRVLREDLKIDDDKGYAKKTVYVRSLGKNGFSHNLVHGYYFGCTTTMLAIQLASYLGCNKIYLLGNDLKYPKGQPRFYKEEEPQDFDPFLSIQLWNIRKAFLELLNNGVEMYNCSKTSNLTPYVPYADFDMVAK